MLWHLRWMLPLLAAGILTLLFSGGSNAPWQGPSWKHPLGTDEFGRDLLGMTAWALIYSLFSGLALTVLAFTVAGAAAFAAVLAESRAAAALVAIAGQVIESIPVLFWLLVAIAVMPEPAWLVQAVAFTLATLPMTSRLMIGEFERLVGEPFVDSARLLGMSRSRVMIRHIVPNAHPILVPLAVQLCGLAVAINGAIGLVGFGNRSSPDLGTLLLRGKEYALTEPQLLFCGIMAVVALYVYLWQFFRLRSDRLVARAELV